MRRCSEFCGLQCEHCGHCIVLRRFGGLARFWGVWDGMEGHHAVTVDE